MTTYVDDAAVAAMERYLKTSVSGGMGEAEADAVLTCVKDAARLNYFSLAVAEAIRENGLRVLSAAATDAATDAPPAVPTGKLSKFERTELAGLIGVAVHTGLRKATDSPEADKAWHAIREMTDKEWRDVLDFAAECFPDPLYCEEADE